MNVIARLEFELAYYNSAVHRFNHSHHEDTPRIFGLLPSFSCSQRFGPNAFWPSSGVSCRTPEPTENLELNFLFDPERVDCSNSNNHDRVQVLSHNKILSISCYLLVLGIEPATIRRFQSEVLFNQTPSATAPCVLLPISGKDKADISKGRVTLLRPLCDALISIAKYYCIGITRVLFSFALCDLTPLVYKGVRPPPRKRDISWNGTKLHALVRLQFWNSEEYEITHSLPLLPDPL